MKAVILAAGYGKRLNPLTNRIPKVMLPLNNKPLLYYQINWLKKNGIKEIAINLHHLPSKIKDYLKKNDFGIKIKISYEKKILGTSGGVKKLENFLKDSTFIVFYGDNITNLNINNLLKFHKKKKGIATICLHEIDKKSIKEASVVELDKNSRILNFIEKPDLKEIDFSKKIYSNAGVYIMEPEVLDFIPKGRFSDFGMEILPRLVSAGKAIFGYPLTGCYWREIGNIEKYSRAKKEITKFKYR